MSAAAGRARRVRTHTHLVGSRSADECALTGLCAEHGDEAHVGEARALREGAQVGEQQRAVGRRHRELHGHFVGRERHDTRGGARRHGRHGLLGSGQRHR
jgi:hypothetical protein